MGIDKGDDMKYYTVIQFSSEQETMQSTFQWQTTPPIEPGWYQAIKFEHTAPQFVFVYFEDDLLVVASAFYNHAMILEDFSHWLGPIPLADAPK
jgi:hypothetical protein